MTRNLSDKDIQEMGEILESLSGAQFIYKELGNS